MKVKLKSLEQFNELLVRKGFSKNGFSKAANISAPMLIQISNGARFPSPVLAKRIAEALVMNFDEIFYIEKSDLAGVAK